MPVEKAPVGEQGRQQRPQEQRLLEIQALEQGCGHSHAEQDHRDPIGAVEAALDSPGQQQQPHADGAAHQVRDFQQGQRDRLPEPCQAVIQGRGRSGEEQDGTGDEGGEGQHRGHHRTAPAVIRRGQLFRRFPVQKDFVCSQQQGRNRQGQQIVDDPEGKQGPYDRFGGQPFADQQQEGRFEYAQSARHLADQAGQLGQEVHPQNQRQGKPVGRRQQGDQHAAGKQPVRRPREKLQNTGPPAGHVDLPVAQVQRCLQKRPCSQVSRDRQRHQQAEQVDGDHGQMQLVRQGQGHQEKYRPAEA